MKNKKIILTIGIPASGKTTWREKFLRDNNDYVAISRDAFRAMYFNADVVDFKAEMLITKMVEDTIVNAIKMKYNVIVDQTNCIKKHLDEMVEFCQNYADVEFRIFEISVEKAIERDKNRPRVVGEKTIRRMYKNYLKLYNANFDFSVRKKIKYIAKDIEFKFDPKKPKAVIFDIDGTLAHMQGMRGTFDWHRVGVDTVNERMRETVLAYWKAGFKIIVVTGRDGVSYTGTKRWLTENDIKFDYLHTKPEDDYRKDSINKTEIYNNHIKGKFNVLCAYDDRDQAVATWRKLGVKCYQVAEGAF